MRSRTPRTGGSMKRSSDNQLSETIDIEESMERWQSQTLAPSLAKSPARRQSFASWSGLPLKAIYTPADVKDIDFLQDVGFPGEYPYTRGPHPAMFRARLWQIRQQTGINTAEATAALKQAHTDGGM